MKGLSLDQFKEVIEFAQKYHIFGHIHDNHDNINKGTRTIHNQRTTFINASCVTDGKFSLGLTSKGYIIDYDTGGITSL